MEIGQTIYLKLVTTEDIIALYKSETETDITVTKPYRVNMLVNPVMGVVTSTISKWIPFECVEKTDLTISKNHIIIRNTVDEEVSTRFLSVITDSENSSEEPIKSDQPKRRIKLKMSDQRKEDREELENDIEYAEILKLEGKLN